METRRGDDLAHLFDRAVRRGELGLVGHVDAVVAGETTGGDEIRTWTPRRPRRSMLTSARIVLPRTIRSSTTRRLPAAICVERVELEPDPLAPELLVGLDERAADVAALISPSRTGSRSAWRSRSRRASQSPGSASRGPATAGPPPRPLAHAHARRVDPVPPSRGQGGRSGRVADAPLPGPAAAPGPVAAVAVDPDELAWEHPTTSAPTRSRRTRLEATTQSSPMRPSVWRPDAERVAERDERAVRDRDDRVGALGPAHHPATRLGERRRSRPSSAAITSVSDVGGYTPSAINSSRSGAGSTRLPLWASATARAAPWWTNGCAFDQ